MTGIARASCIIGWPVEHSRSPLIHNYWLKPTAFPENTGARRCRPTNSAAFVQSLAAHGYVGANVTVPHKEAALDASQPDDRARAVGAANTLWLDGGALRSTNTDVEGFLNNLDACAPGWGRDPGKALVLGGGGAARAVVYALLERGIAPIVVANRTVRRAEALRERFGAHVEPASWDERNAALDDAALVVNTTTLGMPGQPDLALDIGRLPSHAIVADLVYWPLATPLLRMARHVGCALPTGLAC